MRAIEVANELKMLAERLEANPDAEVRSAYIFFSRCSKEQFKSLARILPRPLKKSVKDEDQRFAEVELQYDSPAMTIWATTPQSNTCRLVYPAIPAKYECEPILSPEEDAELEQVVAS